MNRPATEKLRQMLHCASDADFQKQRQTILDAMRAKNPSVFSPKPSMRAVLSVLAQQNGLSIEEQLEETALEAHLIERSMPLDDLAALKRAIADEKKKA